MIMAKTQDLNAEIRFPNPNVQLALFLPTKQWNLFAFNYSEICIVASVNTRQWKTETKR